MQDSPEDISDESLILLWARFGDEYGDLGYRRKSYDLFAKYLLRDNPRLILTGEEIQRRIRVYKKRLRDEEKRNRSRKSD